MLARLLKFPLPVILSFHPSPSAMYNRFKTQCIAAMSQLAMSTGWYPKQPRALSSGSPGDSIALHVVVENGIGKPRVG